MKKILLLTDFTDNATHAAKSAVMLSGKLGTNLLLYHNYAMIPVTPYYAGGAWVAEDPNWIMNESRKSLEKLAEELQPLVDKLKTDHKPLLKCEDGEGNLGESLMYVSSANHIEMVVMGARSGNAFDHILTGSDTNKVINHAKRPILVIPHKVGLNDLKRVVFATDFNKKDINAVKYLAKLGKVFNFQLEIVHISLFGEDDSEKDENEMAFIEQVAKVNYPRVIYRDLRGKNVVDRLKRLCHETKADMLAMVHYQHSFLMRMVIESNTKKALENPDIPVLVFPSGMDE